MSLNTKGGNDVIHPTALIHPSARIGNDVEIGPYCIIKEHATIGDGCHVEGHAVIGSYTTLGVHNHISHGAIVGSEAQDKSHQDENSYLLLGDYNTVREYATLCKGTGKGDRFTRIGSYNYIMNHAHIAHDVIMGDHNVLVNNVQIGGHVHIEDHVTFGCGSGVHQWCNIGRFSMIGAGSKVSQDIVPYMLADGPRAYIQGINSIGLKRNGFTEGDIKIIKQVYRLLFRQQLSLTDATKHIKSLPMSDITNYSLAFLTQSTRGITRMNRK